MIAVSCRVYFGLSERRIAPECISRRRRLWNVEVSMHANQSPLIEEKHAATIYWKFRKFASNSCGVNRWHIGGCGILEGFVQHNELPCQQNDGMMCLFDCCFVVALTMNAIRHRQLLDLLQHNIFQACKINGVCQLCSSRRFLLVFLFCFFLSASPTFSSTSACFFYRSSCLTENTHQIKGCHWAWVVWHTHTHRMHVACVRVWPLPRLHGLPAIGIMHDYVWLGEMCVRNIRWMCAIVRIYCRQIAPPNWRIA